MRKAPVSRDKVGTARFLLARIHLAIGTHAHDALCRAELHTILTSNSIHVRAWLLLAQLYARYAHTHSFAVRCARRAAHLTPGEHAFTAEAQRIVRDAGVGVEAHEDVLPCVAFEETFLLSDSAMWLSSESEDDDDTANDVSRM